MISICVTLKDRSRVTTGERELRLFPNCVHSIVHARREHLEIELVVSDWDSVDWPVAEWLPQAVGDLPLTIVRVEGTFSRGRGRNLAASAAHGEALFFLDADSIISGDVLERGRQHVTAERAYFPVLYSYDDAEHLSGHWRHHGFGNCMVSRTHFMASGGWPEYPVWGKEDDDFHARIAALTEVVREEVPGFYHQWHPEDLLWKDRYVERDPAEIEELRSVAETCRDLESYLPAGASFVLLDEDRFGHQQRVLGRARPFLEVDGMYGGPPADGAHGAREMERMRKEGTRYVAVTWIATWWMDHYPELNQYLERNGKVIIANERLRLYELTR